MATTMLNPSYLPFRIEEFRPQEVGESSWSVSTRVCSRLALLVALLVVLPFPLGVLPGTQSFAEEYTAAWSSMSTWLGDAIGVSGLAAQLIAYVVVAFLATVASLVIDRGNAWGPSLAGATNTMMRFWIASAMLEYGVSRCLADAPATIAAGAVACTAAAALFWRRTATLGALIACLGSLTIVVPSFLSGDAIDLRTWELVAAALVLVIVDAPRLFAALLGFATSARETYTSLSGWWWALSWCAKAGAIVAIVYARVDPHVTWLW